MFMPGSFPGAMPPSMGMGGMPQASWPGLLGMLSPQNLFSIGAMQGLAPIRPPQPMPTPPAQRLSMHGASGLASPSSISNGMGGMSMNPFAMPGMMPMGPPMTAGMSSTMATRPGTMPQMPMTPGLMDVNSLSAFPDRY